MSNTDPFDELVDPGDPDISRPATEDDLRLAGMLSTVWPMSLRHPSDSLHLAIFVNDMRRAAGDVEETP